MLETQTPPAQNLTVDGVAVNVSSLTEAVSSIADAAENGDNFIVCTLNLDHVVQLQQKPEFRAAYRRARFVTADGFPIVVLSRLLGAPVTRTTGADLLVPLCEAAGQRGLPIFLFGSDTATLDKSAEQLRKKFKELQIVGTFSPSPRFDAFSAEADAAIAQIRTSGAKLCFLALGAPRQELFASRCLDELDGTGCLCFGAALDFIGGKQIRAPKFTQKTGLEWAWRMFRDPRRLAPRYARCAAAVPRLLAETLPQILNARMRKAA
jgi:exopolysaccharide biosynthesis WecB/TagA/CpsF family protein